MLQFDVKVKKELFIDDAGNSVPYVAYVMNVDGEDFRLVPKKKDKRLINYLLERKNALPDEKSEYLAVCQVCQEQFRDNTRRRTIDFVAYNVIIFDRAFRFVVREEDRELLKYLLEQKGFFIDDSDVEEEDDDDSD